MARVLGWSAAVAMVMLLPVLIEQVTTDPGNLSELWGVARSDLGSPVGLATAWGSLSHQLSAFPVWAGSALPVTFSGTIDATGSVPVLLIAWVLAMVAAVILGTVGTVGSVGSVGSVGRVRSDGPTWMRAPWMLNSLALAVLVSMLGTVSRMLDDVFTWVAEPTRLAGMLVVLSTGWTVAALRWKESFRSRVSPWLGAVMFCGVVVLVGAAVWDSTDGAEVDLPQKAIAALGQEALGELQTDGPLMVSSEARANTIFGADSFGAVELGLILDRAGIPVVFDQTLENRVGDHRVDPTAAVGEVVITSNGAEPSGEGEWTLIAETDPLDAGQRRLRTQLDKRIRELAGDATLAELFRKAQEDPELADVLEQGASVPDQPTFQLWYRST